MPDVDQPELKGQNTVMPEDEIAVGLFSREELRLAGLACVFEGKLISGGHMLTPVSASLHELLANRQIRFLLVDLNDWTDKRRILDTIHRTRPDLRLIVIGPDEEDLMLEALHAGAKAYLDLTAPLEVVRKALIIVAEGSIWAPRPLIAKLIERLLGARQQAGDVVGPRLTGREEQVLELILSAHSNREIAQQLGIEERTVKAHVGSLMKKTGAGNRVDLSVRALDLPLSMQFRGAASGSEG